LPHLNSGFITGNSLKKYRNLPTKILRFSSLTRAILPCDLRKSAFFGQSAWAFTIEPLRKIAQKAWFGFGSGHMTNMTGSFDFVRFESNRTQ
jgi:hypothetical protein